MANRKSNGNDVETKLEQYFEGQKFFQSGDVAGKKAFFCLGI